MVLTSDAATRTPWLNTIVTEILVLLSLSGIGLPNASAQLQFNGGYVQTRREDYADASSRKGSQGRARSTSDGVPSSPSPDNDFPYPAYRPEAAPMTRSYYYVGEPSRGPVLAPSFSAPRKHSLKVERLSQRPTASPAIAQLVVRLPENAMLWVEGRRIPLQGETSTFRSPPLQAGKKYDYAVRAAWIEDGHWVRMSREVTVEAGQVRAVYLQPSPAPGAQK